MQAEKLSIIAVLSIVAQEVSEMLKAARTNSLESEPWIESIFSMTTDLRDTLADSGELRLDVLTFTTIDSIAAAFDNLAKRFQGQATGSWASAQAQRVWSLLVSLGISRASDGRLILPKA